MGNKLSNSEYKYDKTPAGRLRSARYRKSSKGKVSKLKRNARNLDKIRNDPVRLEKHREQVKLGQAKYLESQKQFTDPAKLLGHPITAKRVAVLSDIQFPWEDENALELTLQFLTFWKPDTVILNGDITDCYACSAWDRDPLKTDTTLSELYKSDQLMKRLAKIPQKIWLGGNHEDRWRRVIWRESCSAGGLSAVVDALMHGIGVEDKDPHEAFRRAFQIQENDFTYWPYGHYVELAEGNLVITHGFLSSQHSAYSAKRHFDRLGRSVIIGHTHRQGSYLVSQLWDPRGAWENGCLCSLNPEYVQFPNWQQGFSLVTITDNLFHVDQVPILPKYRIEYQGRTFKL